MRGETINLEANDFACFGMIYIFHSATNRFWIKAKLDHIIVVFLKIFPFSMFTIELKENVNLMRYTILILLYLSSLLYTFSLIGIVINK